MEKGEVIPDNTVLKRSLPLFVENYYWDPHYEFGDQTLRQERIANKKVS